ncbi:hypothetical protein BU23DRAFT_537112 [Bimuria novae-zelandiae CBS 107.79]|uniref:Uncharacterized protein n=1 Tax=Bimuria novae-zelandiae CBS 107.79 TaxID=1447943 RepID=A0A6A5VCI7_9PLEO|nr:hypothetical protein BU23DRAFT_537112 [Bimuria novae-zelandiae CBS 107.79]
MSQYPSIPPPGAYTPPNQTPQPQGFNQQQQQQQQQPHYGYQQPQAPYGAPAPGYTPSGSHKPTKAFGQVLNQAVTQGRPMLDKLGKSISSKLGNKQPKQSTPNHLQSYQNYQQHQQPQIQQYQQTQTQNHSHQGQPFASGQQSVYQTPQQSPFGQSAYGSPASANSGQSNYFPPQAPPTPHQQAVQYQQIPQHPPGSGNPGEQSSNDAGQPQSLPTQTPLGQASGQQTGVIGNSHSQAQNATQQSPAAQAPSGVFTPEQQQQQQQQQQQHQQQQQQQQQWTAPVPHHQPPPAPQSPVSFHPTPPPQQYGAAPPVPMHLNQQMPQQTPQPQQSPQPLQQQWTPMSPVSSQTQQVQLPPSASSPPPPPSDSQYPAAPIASQQLPPQQPSPNASQPQLAQSPNPVSLDKPGPTEFIAELPADLGNASIVEGSKSEQPSTNPSQAAQYQAYRPVSGQSASSGRSHTISRRAVSTSSMPLADPWRFADAVTELPTREFYILADLIFDAIDRRFEPQNTGLLEASKVLESWRAQELPEEAAQLFAHDSYGTFAKIWSLEGVPHIMVPIQPSLMPTWNFQQQIHSQEMRIQEQTDLGSVTYITYMPALNRAGWYKYLFLNLLHQPEELEKLLGAFCADTYKPSILNQPDLQKRDKNESPGLVSRATAISTEAVSRVCQEVVAQMQGTSQQDASQQGDGCQGEPEPQPNNGGLTDADIAMKMHSLQIQRQFNNMMNHTVTQGGISFSSAAGNVYKPNYGSFM